MASADSSKTAAPLAQFSLSRLIGTFFYIGHFQPGPGTWASLVTALLWWAAAAAWPAAHLWEATLAAAAVVTLIGIPASGAVERASGITDPGFVVIDEVAGQLIALISLPARWQYILASFILFRSFDIVKPPPLRQLERLPGGWGIMLDDVAAGLCSLAVMRLWMLWTHAR